MTTTQPRRLTALFRALRHLNWDPTGLGEAVSGSARFPESRPQADPARAKQAHPAGKVPARV
jgi:hypothetical protein